MTTLTKIIVTTMMALLLASCQFNFNPGVEGNGNVLTQNRELNTSFSSIKASDGLDIYLTQGNEEKVSVQADENLHDLINIEVEGGELKVYSKENIGHASAKKVIVTYKSINKITSTSGSDIHVTNVISAQNLELRSSSGSNMELKVNTNTISCKSSSGSGIELSGKAEKLYAEASSGSEIDAPNLNTVNGQAKASSGASITINVSKELTAKATSGGNVNYLGSPEKVYKNDSMAGIINQR